MLIQMRYRHSPIPTLQQARFRQIIVHPTAIPVRNRGLRSNVWPGLVGFLDQGRCVPAGTCFRCLLDYLTAWAAVLKFGIGQFCWAKATFVNKAVMEGTKQSEV